jgi:ABC-type glycerol-3-phosphate transport system substrate-binding protein
MKRKFATLLICTILVCLIILGGCQASPIDVENNDNSTDLLKVYLTETQYTQTGLKVYIDSYNKVCDEQNREQDKIEIKYFENSDDMKLSISAEIMAGGGPDIIDDRINDHSVNLFKFIENGAFADVNELIANDSDSNKLNIDDLNKTVMDAGVFDGKRVIVPTAYMVNTYLSAEETLAQYGIAADDEITYSNSDEKLASVLAEMETNEALQPFMSPHEVLRDLINENVDFINKTHTLNTDEFKSNFRKVSKLCKNVDDDLGTKNYVFTESGFGRPESRVDRYILDYSYKEKTTVFVENLFSPKGETEAVISSFLAINNNSKKKEQAYKFVKFMLTNSSYKTHYGQAIPVNNKAFESCCEKARTVQQVGDSIIVDTTEFLAEYKTIVGSITSCTLENDYYRVNIIDPVLDDFMDGKITVEKFFEELASKTFFYFDE